MRFSLVGFLLSLVVSVSSAESVSSRWERSHGPEGGPIGAVVVDPLSPDTVYAVGGSVFKSRDSGRTWYPLKAIVEGAFRGALAVDPRTSGIVYLGTGGGVLRSTDGGRTWHSRSTGMFRGETREERGWRLGEGWVTELAIAASNPRIVYAGTYGGVFKTTNGGRAWKPVNRGLTFTGTIDGRKVSVERIVNAVAVDPRDPKKVYVGTPACCVFKHGGIFRSMDGGGTWRRIGLSNATVYAVVLDPRDSTVYAGTSGGVFTSRDGGRSWRNLGLAPTWELLHDPVRPATLYAVTNAGVFRSTNRGWARVPVALTQGDTVSSIAVDSERRALYVGTRRGIYKSTNGGVAWRAANEGLTATAVAALALDRASSKSVYAGMWGDGIFKSMNGGGSWTAAYGGLTARSVTALAVDPQSRAGVFAGTDGGVFKSTNGGGSWSPSGLRVRHVQALAIASDASAVYAGTDGAGVFKSVDDGSTWSHALPSERIFALVVDPQSPRNIYAGSTGKVLKSADGGATWRSVITGQVRVAALALDPANPLTIYAGTYRGEVLKSADGGASWGKADTGSPDSGEVIALAVDPRRPWIVYAGTSGEGVFRSTDGGRTWRAFNQGLPVLDVRVLAVAKDGTAFAGTSGGGVVAFRPS
jgi:photosystem II stability/assembly factor-like uncharacterized protein